MNGNTPLRRSRTALLTALCLLALPGTASPLRGQVEEGGVEPSPGLLSLASGHVFMVCEGESGPLPTLVFENGLGAGYDTWRDVQPAMARLTRTCAYDRLGAGQSDPVAEDDTRTPFEQATTLHEALDAAGVVGPIVLVGHSIGAFVLLAYPHLYPDDVTGLVFVDGSHPQQWIRFREVDPSATDPVGASGAERIDRGAATDELANVGSFGDLPIAVLYQARPTDSPLRPIWVEFQRDHANRSTRHRLIPAKNSGHYVHNDEPHLVIEAIRWVMGEAEGASS